MRKAAILLLLIITTISCDTNRVYDRYQTIQNGWNIQEPVQFEISDVDSITPYNVFIKVRNTNDYKYSNLFLITRMNFPNGKQITDTLEYVMATPEGAWLGTGFNDIKENKLWYKEGVRFRESGTYQFSIEHAVRKNGNITGDERLEGITEVGLRIERPQNQE
ncbi:gliding motility lipoprotein GldH [uncultured Dokdonia sp.]|uniref:gliding motility lipoprotein GldH n=1 Tax=uncultured Dokdonia sp. TaxID=575653 RepID=UPI00261A6344|nr:gliding motility lipoprotein GldH [uncultured Dokdonia sp.]